MKHVNIRTGILGIALLWGLRGPAAAQEGTGWAAPVRSEHYVVMSDAGDGAAVSREMEKRFEAYNRLFRFEAASGELPLLVRVYRNEESYNNYLSARLGETRPGAVYLHYRQSSQRELVLHRGSPGENQALPYQAFIQFLRAFAPYPPSWMREGFAIYFSALTAGAAGELTYTENLAWLDAVKSMEEGARSPESVLLADQRGYPPDFQILSWALVSFFLNSGREEYFRTLTESFLLLSGTASAAENSQAVMERIARWNPPELFRRDFNGYIDSRKTFTEFIEDGQRAYAARDPAGAETAFRSALDQKPDHYAPHYYLGLLAYEEGSFNTADRYYQAALEYGADAALVYYALGVNAASAGKTGEAVEYLRQAAAVSPERYREKSESLIQRLR
jgi:tetratricopeptide (TPR) repeat protein